MPYCVMFHDAPEKEDVRTALRPAHIEYMNDHLDILLASGGLLDDSGSTAFGGLIVLDTDDRSVAEAFVRGDPFWQGGLFREYTLYRWRKAFLDRKCFL